MNRKLQIAYIFSAFAVLSYLSVKTIPIAQHPDTQSVMAPAAVDSLLIVQRDQDGILIPLNVELNSSMSEPDKMQKMIELMSSDVDNSVFESVLPASAALNEAVISDRHVNLDFNEGFLAYDAKDELAIVESLVWAATQFDDIDTVSISVNGNALNQMPLKGTPLSENLDRRLGFNNFESATATLHDSHNLNIYYVKEINGTEYYVPKSRRINGGSLDVNDVIETILSDISVTSTLAQPLALERVTMSEPVEIDVDTLVIHLDNSILNEEATGKEEALNTLVLSIHEVLGFDNISILVDGVPVNASGSNEEHIQVSSIEVNRIKL
ncbi:GerMN domain-containing protein [Dielma fastidiosa]|uniref:GerMN domain-containing protein n=1 Tax=Dielma fastidiosa TaxID=1034346 RepID=UPI0015FD8224|nr:GerMN domain-containing protein [Dielma fastidiosa]